MMGKLIQYFSLFVRRNGRNRLFLLIEKLSQALFQRVSKTGLLHLTQLNQIHSLICQKIAFLFEMISKKLPIFEKNTTSLCLIREKFMGILDQPQIPGQTQVWPVWPVPTVLI